MASSYPLSLVSYNMHGYNQGRSTLDHLCAVNEANIDIIFLQEHWLTPQNLNKIKFFSDRYIAYGISAMENVISKSVLKGRPFGGCCSLVKSNLGSKVKFSKCSERFVALCLDNLLLINVYFPYVGNDNDLCTVQSMFAEIDSIICMFPNHRTILAGDFNCNIGINCVKTALFQKFIDQFSLIPCNRIIDSNINFTYCHESLQNYSYIDFICISNSVSTELTEFKVLDLAFNLSDHLPIYARFSIVNDVQCPLATNQSAPSSQSIQSALRWDHANLHLYYNLSRELLQPLYDSLKSDYGSIMSAVHASGQDGYSSNTHYVAHSSPLLSAGSGRLNNLCRYDSEANFTDNSKFDFHLYVTTLIEDVYNHVTSFLNIAADSTIPVVKSNYFKYWWTEETNALKSNSCLTHSNWVNAGRPMNGPVYDAKRIAKTAYKKCIKDNQKVELETVSNQLHDALICKSQNGFWKSWRNKFSNKKLLPPIVEGMHDDESIANGFAKYFSNVCTVELNPTSASLAKQFTDRLSSYRSTIDDNECFVDVELLDGIIKGLSKGKAAGIDRLTAEHIQYCHPIVISILAMLFNIMFKYEYVPDAFGVGIIVPIPKKDSKCNFDKHADYRGITISSVISKIFELCIVDNINDKLATSDLQFGFKKGFGCNHAIFAARSVISYCTSNKSTISLCSLDVAKAFDKVNHHALFLKLMDRNIHRNLIQLLSKWYNKIFAIVKWNMFLSNSVKISAGVRQGGVLSPYLFAILVDDILIKLKQSKLGCRVRGQLFNAIMYADDLLLMSMSLSDLQSMLDICVQGFRDIGLSINADKSMCMRIGPRFKTSVAKLKIGHLNLEWKHEIRFLGVSFLASSVVKCNLQTVRQKFFRALNGLFGKIGSKSSTIVSLSLINTFCVPLLTYGIECFVVSKSMYNTLESAYSSAFAKLFSTFDKAVIRQCQYYCHTSPLSDIIDLRILKFLHGMKFCNNMSIQFLFQVSGLHEMNNILNRNSLLTQSSYNWKNVMWNNFANSVFGCNS